MAIIAVAGGTGNVGRAIVDAIVATGKHSVIVLSRKTNAELEKQLGVPIVAVDYADVSATARTLEEHKVSTLISSIAMHSADGTPPLEPQLIQAAEASSTTTRLISSEWGVPSRAERAGQITSVQHKLTARAELERTRSLEWTVVHNGYFMDYWGLPRVPSYLARTPLVYWIDMAHRRAAIPGSGNVPVVFTHTSDVGRFVAALVTSPAKWEPDSFVRGDRLTWNQFLALAQAATDASFDVTYDDLDTLRACQATPLPGIEPLYAFVPQHVLQSMGSMFGLWFEEGMFDLDPAAEGSTGFLNDRFPDIRPMTVKEMLDRAWKN